MLQTPKEILNRLCVQMVDSYKQKKTMKEYSSESDVLARLFFYGKFSFTVKIFIASSFHHVGLDCTWFLGTTTPCTITDLRKIDR